MLSSMDCSAWCLRSTLRKVSSCIVRACSGMAVNGVPLQSVIWICSVSSVLCDVQTEAVSRVAPLQDGVGRDTGIHGDDGHQVGAAHELRVNIRQIVSQAWADPCHADAEAVVCHGVEHRLACEDARRG